MRVLIATPANGGQVTVQYLTSFIDTYIHCISHNQEYQRICQQNNQPIDPRQLIQIAIYTLASESLLPRGRNHCAQVALMNGWDKVFFIDADAGWTPNDFFKIVGSPHPIIGGACPLKTFPISLNFLPFKDDEKHFENAIRSVQSMEMFRDAYQKTEIPVAFLGTAFFCIQTKVLQHLSQFTKSYKYPNPSTGQPETHWDFFNCTPIGKQYMSEDWGFCHLARQQGYDITLNTEVLITHTGNHTYRGELKPFVPKGQLSVLPPEPLKSSEVSPKTAPVVKVIIKKTKNVEVTESGAV